ncbi:uncharacterized protein LOC144715645 [Wolffia australiana]
MNSCCMGRRLSSPAAAAAATAAAATTNLRHLARIAVGKVGKIRNLASPKSSSSPKSAVQCSTSVADLSVGGNLGFERNMENSGERLPLSEVVSDCAKRWFQDTLKEAKSGDVGMQVLVGQMYYSGYGIGRNVQKGKAWISRASRYRSSASKVADKRPGYNVSDSESDDLNEVAN